MIFWYISPVGVSTSFIVTPVFLEKSGAKAVSALVCGAPLCTIIVTVPAGLAPLGAAAAAGALVTAGALAGLVAAAGGAAAEHAARSAPPRVAAENAAARARTARRENPNRFCVTVPLSSRDG